ncbi:MAG: EAL domain-containing response regulator [Gammaproteobacteria bacterium]
MQIMLIDDEPFALRLLARQLANLGFAEVIEFERADDALAVLENDIAAIGLVFCDLQMPEFDGVEFVRHVARIKYGGGLVLVSGEDERILKTAKTLAEAHQLNVLGALHKPVAPEALRKILYSQPSSPAPVTADYSARKTYDAEELRDAITNGELINYYQPKVEVASGRVFGVESLVRWRHPENGLVFPDQFITTAEKHGLIDELTRVVLTTALRQARIWQDAGLSLSVAVNVSMENLGTLEFPDWVAREASDAKVPLANLVLEVTESQLMKSPLTALEILTRLRLKNIGLSIDDFGTGYSSLAQLRDIPFGELKVDQGFVHGAHKDESRRAIFEASLTMARQLGMKTVAEGVEDQEDWDFLRASTCDLAQGYFIARPMPAENLADWIVEWNARRDGL